MKLYEKGDRIPVRAQQAWNILVGHASFKPTGTHDLGWSNVGVGLITYSDLAIQMGMDSKAGVTLGRHLGVIGYYCQEQGIPPLNAIVVNKTTEAPGHGVVETLGYRKDQKDVLSFNWYMVRTPTTGALREIYDKYIAQNH